MGTVLVLATLLLAGASLGAALLWFWWSRKGKRERQELRSGISELRTEVHRIATELNDRDSAPIPGTGVPNGFNLNRRAEAVRRLRAGVPLDAVAGGTGWSAAEVALLRKVEQLAEKDRISPNQFRLAK